MAVEGIKMKTATVSSTFNKQKTTMQNAK